MNIALQAFVLLCIYLPGAFVFLGVSGRLFKDQEAPLLGSSMTGRAVVALVVAMLFHFFWILAIYLLSINKSFGYQPLAKEFFLLIASPQSDKAYGAAVQRIGSNLGSIGIYFLSIWVAGGMLGEWLRRIIESKHLERRYKWLRLKPSWHYLLCGDDHENIGLRDVAVMVDLLTETEVGDSLSIYSGVVARYWFDDKSGELEVIVLENQAERIPLRFDPATGQCVAGRPEPISGHILAVPMSQVKNVNVVYLV